ncbi:class I SAM-dependent methyltransferase [Novosphingobium lindaniclasticum]
MPQANVYRVSEWSGKSGERWVSNQARLDAMLEHFGAAAIEAAVPVPGEQVLDIGCGAGATSRVLADRVGPDGHVTGIDISAALIERARGLYPADTGLDFELEDAGSADLGAARFDLLYSRFGVMFFAEPVAAFTNLRLALKPGGRAAFVCWRGADENDWVRLPMGAIKGIVPASPPPEPDAPGPFSFGDGERVRSILSLAGFTDIAIAPFDREIPFGLGTSREGAIDDAVDMAFEVGPLSRALADAAPDVRKSAAAAVRDAFARRPGEHSVMIDGAAWIVTARNASS